eukprot:CAMPEP_0170395542 /NCGR_PEP_ID=MMETSP0117_2-20130122/21834_1 /TAXON_ID=400756 /ORGANISM="Durinskia baltica, Strain CSIRO CS-38" /LENGTH=226 /DNA_ID=CAMNT_0010651859 /DNA_START=79 /DNA_END=761 /DNA_ORIENTATION=+
MEDSNPNNNGLHVNPPTPLFERLVTEEVQEQNHALRMIDNQQRRLNELERVHGDLETRLEQESRGRAQLETTLEQREREWASKFKELELDRDHWKDIVKQEKAKNAKLIHQVVRKDQDIHRMLQRKYDRKGDSPNGPHSSVSTRNVRQLSSERPAGPGQLFDERPAGPGQLQVGSDGQSITNSNYRAGVGEQQQYKSPHEILAASGSMEAVRIRNVQNLLTEFFAL